MGWALGSTSVSLWNEPWLSTEKPRAPMGPPTEENQAWKVSNLIDSVSKEWDLRIIRDTVPQYEEEICKLVPSSFPLEDERVWLLNASGTYTTKSGYAVAKLCIGKPESQTLIGKNCIWQVKTSPKIQHFLWKATSKALPVGSLLESRGIAVSPVCKLCEPERLNSMSSSNVFTLREFRIWFHVYTNPR